MGTTEGCVVEPVSSDGMQCSFKHFTIMCCHHRRPREANMPFPRLPVHAALPIVNVNFLIKNFFEKELTETKRLPSMSNPKLPTTVYL